MQKRHRIFIAINLPPDIKKFLAGFEKKHKNLPAKWTPLENLHITIVFLGDLTDEELGEVCIITKNVAEKYTSFNVVLKNVKYGPEGSPVPRYIWAGGEKSKELSDLKNDLEESLSESVRFVKENRGFTPHITLARINSWQWKTINPEERPEANENFDLVFTVESIEVMESELKRGGPKYIIIESHLLR